MSFGLQCFPVKAPGWGIGPPVVTCHGQVYHLAGRLFPDDDESARYSQLYMYDHGEALKKRGLQYPDLGEQTMRRLQEMMEEVSPYVAKYRQMGQLAQTTPTVRLGFLSAKGSDVSRYSAPTTMEAGVIFVGDEGVPETNRDIVIWPHE